MKLGLRDPPIHFPLMCLVDYLGFRLQALSLLPIHGGTLVYGTADGGRTMHNTDGRLSQQMMVAGAKLNLKPHVAGLSSEGCEKCLCFCVCVRLLCVCPPSLCVSPVCVLCVCVVCV